MHVTPGIGILSMMADVDLNLLPALDALLAESSVAGAAQRLGPSASAMSRTLARLRAATGDPLLVRAGRRLVPTPHAASLREGVRNLTLESRAVLRPAVKALDFASLERTFTIRANDGFVEVFAAHLIAAVTSPAPRVRLHFAPKPNKDVGPLRDGVVDLEVGVADVASENGRGSGSSMAARGGAGGVSYAVTAMICSLGYRLRRGNGSSPVMPASQYGPASSLLRVAVPNKKNTRERPG
jgi:hypothetical protein